MEHLLLIKSVTSKNFRRITKFWELISLSQSSYLAFANSSQFKALAFTPSLSLTFALKA